MDPVSILTAVSLGSTVLGGIVGAMGEEGKGQAEARSLRLQGEAKGQGYEADTKAYMYKAGIAEMNKKVKLQDADYARWAGETEAQQSGMKTRFNISTAKAKQAGSGLEVDFGSPSAVRDSILEIGQYDQSMIRTNAAKKAYGFQVEAATAEADKTLNEMAAEKSTTAAMFARQGAGEAADTAETAGHVGAMKSILGASSSVASKWIQGSSLGMTGGGTGHSSNPWSEGGVGTSGFWGNN